MKQVINNTNPTTPLDLVSEENVYIAMIRHRNEPKDFYYLRREEDGFIFRRIDDFTGVSGHYGSLLRCIEGAMDLTCEVFIAEFATMQKAFDWIAEQKKL